MKNNLSKLLIIKLFRNKKKDKKKKKIPQLKTKRIKKILLMIKHYKNKKIYLKDLTKATIKNKNRNLLQSKISIYKLIKHKIHIQ
jgi:hypothetical protein